MGRFDDDFDDGPSLQAGAYRSTAPEDENPRRLLVILLDCSGSMGQVPSGQDEQGPTPIEELRSALANFVSYLAQSPFAENGEIAIGLFQEMIEDQPVLQWLHLGVPVYEDARIYWAQNVSPRSLKAEWLTPAGRTPIGAAVEASLLVVRSRSKELAQVGHMFHPRPVLLVLTDGRPTDNLTAATALAHEMEDRGEIALWIAVMQGTNTVKLSALADKGNLIELGDKGIAAFVTLMSMTPTAIGRTARDIYAGLLSKWKSEMS